MRPGPVKNGPTSRVVYDFGTHTNDFVVPREKADGTEVFLVRVPAGGAVPPHTHADVEQTFVFVSGTATATISRDGDVRSFSCRPGDVVFVPANWLHTVSSENGEEVLYVTVNAFVPGVERDGDTALGHSATAHQGFIDRNGA